LGIERHLRRRWQEVLSYDRTFAELGEALGERNATGDGMDRTRRWRSCVSTCRVNGSSERLFASVQKR